MRQTTRWVLLGILAVTLLSAGALLLSNQLGWEAQRRIIERRASAALGLEVSIEGDLELTLLPALEFQASDVSVGNLPGRPSPYLARVGKLDLQLSLLALLRRELAIDALELEEVDLRIENDPNGHVEVAEKAANPGHTAEERDLLFSIGRLTVRNLRVRYQPGDANTLRLGEIEFLEVQADPFDEPMELSGRGEFEGYEFNLSGRLGSLSRLLSRKGLYPFTVRGEFPDATLEIEGTSAEPLSLRDLDLELAGTVPNLNTLYGRFRRRETPLPELGGISFEARLRRSSGPISIENLVLETDARGTFQGSLIGSVYDLQNFRGTDLRLELSASSLSFLQPLIDLPLPEIDSIETALHFTDHDTTLGVEGKLEVFLPDDRGHLELAGEHDNLRKIEGIDIAARARTRDLAVLGELVGLERPLPPIGPVAVSGQIRDQDQQMGVYALEAKAGTRDGTWAEVNGSVRDLLTVEGAVLSAQFGAADLDDLETYLGRPLPSIGPLSGYTTLTDQDGTLGLEPFHLHGGQEDLLSLDLDASFDDLREIDDVDVATTIRARDLAVIGQLLDLELDPIGPVEFTGEIRGSDEDIESSGKVRIDRTWIEGQWKASMAADTRPRIRADLHSAEIWLDDIGIQPRDTPGTQTDKADEAIDPATDSTQRWWEGSDAITFERLRALDLELSVRADKISGRAGFVIHDAGLSLGLRDGKLELRDLEAKWAGGETRAGLIIDARTPETTLSLDFDLEGLNIEQVASQVNETTEASGIVDARLRLKSQGESRDQIRSNLSGPAIVIMRDGTAAGEISQRFVRNFVGLTFPTLKLRARAPLVSCFLAAVDIEAGRAEVRQLQMQGGNITVQGSGTIDLVEDHYDLELVPKSRSRGLVSVAPVVRIDGPLQSPRARPVQRTILTSVVEGVIANAIRPIEAVISPFRWGSQPEFQCALTPAAAGS